MSTSKYKALFTPTWPLYFFLAAISGCQIAQAQEVVVNPGETHSFSVANNCEGTALQQTFFKLAFGDCVLEDGRAEAAAALTINAINKNVSAYGAVDSDFKVPGTASTVLDASVSADVAWDGVLFGAGILGAGANFEISMSLVDLNTGAVKGNTTVVTKAQDSIGLKGVEVGGTRFTGTRTVSFPATVVRGHDHYIRLTVTCNAESGLIGIDIGCIFAKNAFDFGLGDHYARWTSLSVTVEQDLSERFDQIDAKLEQMDSKLDAMSEKLDGLKNGQEQVIELEKEAIRLLLVPQGRRETDVLDCDGQSCDFPQKD